MADKYEIIFDPEGGFFSSERRYRYAVEVNGERIGLSSDFLWKARWNVRRAIRRGKRRVIETWQG